MGTQVPTRTQMALGFVVAHIQVLIKIQMALGSAGVHILAPIKIQMALGSAGVHIPVLIRTRMVLGFAVVHIQARTRIRMVLGFVSRAYNEAAKPSPRPCHMMNEEMLQAFVEHGTRWVEVQSAAFRPIAQSLSASARHTFSSFFDPETLDIARFARTTRIENPEFLAAFTEPGKPVLCRNSAHHHAALR